MLSFCRFTGIHCETNIDDCESTPCQHDGVCQDGVSRFECDCPSAWEGVQCQLPVDECASNPCMNNGFCEDLVGGYSCRCLDGFSGILLNSSIFSKMSTFDSFIYYRSCISGAFINY